MAILGASTWAHLLNAVVIFLGLLVILVVLIQRGKGGGLAGAFGGVGGSNPFGSRGADAFVKFTIYLAIAWFLVIMIQGKVIQRDARQAKPRVLQE